MAIHGLSESLYPKKPAHFNLESLIRPNILALHPYRCARDDYSEGILLDANENSLGHSIQPQKTTRAELDEIEGLDLHRYPSPSHEPIKSKIAHIRNLPGPAHVFLGVGSDEVIDLLIRIIVKPGGEEKILITPPTYGMYSVCAQINDVGVVKVPLELESTHGEGGESGRFSLRVDKVQCVRSP
jgi:histidinol-phosphate aminotransferase